MATSSMTVLALGLGLLMAAVISPAHAAWNVYHYNDDAAFLESASVAFSERADVGILVRVDATKHLVEAAHLNHSTLSQSDISVAFQTINNRSLNPIVSIYTTINRIGSSGFIVYTTSASVMGHVTCSIFSSLYSFGQFEDTVYSLGSFKGRTQNDCHLKDLYMDVDDYGNMGFMSYLLPKFDNLTSNSTIAYNAVFRTFNTNISPPWGQSELICCEGDFYITDEKKQISVDSRSDGTAAVISLLKTDGTSKILELKRWNPMEGFYHHIEHALNPQSSFNTAVAMSAEGTYEVGLLNIRGTSLEIFRVVHEKFELYNKSIYTPSSNTTVLDEVSLTVTEDNTIPILIETLSPTENLTLCNVSFSDPVCQKEHEKWIYQDDAGNDNDEAMTAGISFYGFVASVGVASDAASGDLGGITVAAAFEGYELDQSMYSFGPRAVCQADVMAQTLSANASVFAHWQIQLCAGNCDSCDKNSSFATGFALWRPEGKFSCSAQSECVEIKGSAVGFPTLDLCQDVCKPVSTPGYTCSAAGKCSVSNTSSVFPDLNTCMSICAPAGSKGGKKGLSGGDIMLLLCVILHRGLFHPQPVTAVLCFAHTKGGGSLSCPRFFCAFLIPYLAIGSIYNYSVKGARGMEILPNYHFWVDSFPGLVGDGFRFCMCRPVMGGGNYEAI
ncbi:uncharacterized protein MONBRDRAFT_38514 [Monosiga brevicollis MX1]|uniref:Uncharacterized protein n=1 Tax=Monosiga brevicollis TaxID=81824 RepID=A9V8D4_MONBE|nr:uncharacterized protein MONBRDRAFT_38514 [Monosiga brevicollis MX1]EDQ86320.1 predicted protein [Monosiga brevicollis MX1]|eukprot:XP_001748990.1 hypothetical protein [Monosiga brevicollis MX1]